jgi:hypothetical protein
MLRYDDAEYDVVASAASRAGMTPTGYAAHVALDGARDTNARTPDANREVLLELMACRSQLRRYGNNLNQAARILNAGGDAPEWLKAAIALTDRVVHNIDRAVQDLLDPPRGRT